MRAMILGVCAVTIASVGAPAVAAQETPPALTVAQAKRIVRQYDRANTTNNDTLDVAGQSEIEAPPIQPIDDFFFADRRGRGELSLGPQLPLERFRVHVPEQTGYPLQFLAAETIGGDEANLQQLLVFARPSEAEPWRVTMAAQLIEADLPAIPKNPDGFARLLDADHAGTLKVAPDELAAEVTDIWADAAGEERAPSREFDDGPLTTGIVDLFVTQLFDAGVRGNADYAFEPAGEFPVVGYRAADDRGLVFSVIRVRETITPTSSDGLVQPQGREVFGGGLEPGQYGSVRYERLAILAAGIPPESAKRAKVRIIGIYEGAVSVEGDPPGTTTA